MLTSLKRRGFLTALASTPFFAAQLHAAELNGTLGPKQGRLKQSVMPQVWGTLDLTIEERCEILSTMGFSGMDLADPEQIPVLNDYGIRSTMMVGTGTTFADGLVRRKLHDHIEEATFAGIDMCVEANCPNLIILPGERRGMSRQEGADNSIEILSRVASYAEEKGVMLCMENTNSKVEADGRTDQTFDKLEWGFDVCRRVGSPNVKIVFDIYHAQISDGDIVRNLRENLDLICHIHAAGVPSRAEINETQELNYRYIAQQIADMGYDGYVAQEYNPTPGLNPIISLATGYEILTV